METKPGICEGEKQNKIKKRKEFKVIVDDLVEFTAKVKEAKKRGKSNV